jgi:Skp family chaperone for outer membrane proteins
VQGGATNLFGSSIQHHERVEMEVKIAEKSRHLNTNWYHARGTIITIQMSPAQFAEAITTMNCGQGVPITIMDVDGKMVASCPEANERQKFEREFKEQVQEATEVANTLVKEAKEILDKKTILKADREKLRGLVDKLERETTSSMPFIQSQFNEACDATVKEAKAEVDATVLHAVVSAGLDTIAKGGAKEIIARHMPQLTEGKKDSENTE